MAAALSMRELESRIGQEVGVSPWVEVTQERIDLFARAIDDPQWIHVDVERAKQSPFGGTIAHGFLTLSLLSKFIESTFSFADRKMGVNYGLNRVRFTAPLPSGSRVRARFKLLKYERIEGNGAQVTWDVTCRARGKRQAGARRRVDRKELLLMAQRWKQRPPGSNWGDFGPDDQRGRMNWVTREKVLQGVAEVKEGLTFVLSLPLDYPGGNALNPRRNPPRIAATQRSGAQNFCYAMATDDPRLTDVVCDDLVLLTLQYSTQWDSFAHIGASSMPTVTARPRSCSTTAFALASM
jgi:acyl dehydratase